LNCIDSIRENINRTTEIVTNASEDEDSISIDLGRFCARTRQYRVDSSNCEIQMNGRKHSIDQDQQKKLVAPNIHIAFSDEMRRSTNRVDPSGMSFLAFWRGQIVYENGRVKRFESEDEAYEFLARCDSAGRIVH
jgi:hypothetical protein